MVGLPASKIRFYDKYGVFKCQRNSSGYRFFTAQDAFRANAFRILRGYGFSIEKAVMLLNAQQDSPEFVESLFSHYKNIETRIEQLKWQKQRLLKTIGHLNGDHHEGFEITNMENHLYVCASEGPDFSISNRNSVFLEVFADLVPITSFARILPLSRILSREPLIIPNYVNTIPLSHAGLLGSYDRNVVKEISLGEVVYFQRKLSRKESLERDSFRDLFDYLSSENLTIAGDIIIFPSFLNLDGNGKDWEELYVPIKKLKKT